MARMTQTCWMEPPLSLSHLLKYSTGVRGCETPAFRTARGNHAI